MVRGIVMLEGPDGCGKTTLARHLVDHHGAYYIHGRVHKDVWKYHVAALRLAAKRSEHQLVVIDRNWPSEAVYGCVFRDGLAYEPAERSLDRVFMKHATVHVMCLPSDPDFITKQFDVLKQERVEHYPSILQVQERYRQAYHGYTHAEPFGNYLEQMALMGGVKKIRPDWLLYDYRDFTEDIEPFAQLLLSYMGNLRSQQHRGALNPKRTNFCGYLPTADIFFIGEQPGGDENRATDWPFFSRKGASKYLNESLRRIRFNEHRAVWTNALHKDQHIAEVVRQKPDIKIITLGRAAQKLVETLGYDIHAALRHPQWEARFNRYGDKGFIYYEQIRKVIRDDYQHKPSVVQFD